MNLEQYRDSLRSIVNKMEKDFICGNHGNYIPLDIAQTKIPFFGELQHALNDAVKNYISQNDLKIENLNEKKLPIEFQKSIEILVRDLAPPKQFGRNPL